jgi:hypothetical protein
VPDNLGGSGTVDIFKRDQLWTYKRYLKTHISGVLGGPFFVVQFVSSFVFLSHVCCLVNISASFFIVFFYNVFPVKHIVLRSMSEMCCINKA